ncbi:hypothetical protein MC885_021535 [Smutsia gigantea]|nr:hypothetical protein MC885_021535 [Smutsia gigantea]
MRSRPARTSGTPPTESLVNPPPCCWHPIHLAPTAPAPLSSAASPTPCSGSAKAGTLSFSHLVPHRTSSPTLWLAVGPVGPVSSVRLLPSTCWSQAACTSWVVS